MHVLAYLYHWGRQELWYCPVRERKLWVERVLDQIRSEQEQIENAASKDSQSSSTYKES